MMPRRRRGESPDGGSRVEATQARAPAALDESVEHVLRRRLLLLRAELCQRLVEVELLESRWLAMLADCEVLIQALDGEAP